MFCQCHVKEWSLSLFTDTWRNTENRAVTMHVALHRPSASVNGTIRRTGSSWGRRRWGQSRLTVSRRCVRTPPFALTWAWAPTVNNVVLFVLGGYCRKFLNFMHNWVFKAHFILDKWMHFVVLHKHVLFMEIWDNKLNFIPHNIIFNDLRRQIIFLCSVSRNMYCRITWTIIIKSYKLYLDAFLDQPWTNQLQTHSLIIFHKMLQLSKKMNRLRRTNLILWSQNDE